MVERGVGYIAFTCKKLALQIEKKGWPFSEGDNLASSLKNEMITKGLGHVISRNAMLHAVEVSSCL
jgi:hypothetical protein